MMFGMFEVLYAYLTRMLGNRSEGADPNGSLHAKTKDIKGDVTSINGKVDSILNKSTVRSVQSGSATFNYNTGTSLTINISAVNRSKSLVFITTYGVPTLGTEGATGVYATGMIAASLSSTQLYLYRGSNAPSGSNGTVGVCWQIIEFN